MKRIVTVLVLSTVCAFVASGRVMATHAPLIIRAKQIRTVYFGAVDRKGAAVTDLTAAELTVKEGGKDREIGSLEAASAPLQVSILVDDGGSGAFQPTVVQFLQATLGHAKFTISVFSPQAMRVVNYTDDVDELKSALGRLGPRGWVQSDGLQMIDAIGDAAHELQKREAQRPVILAMTVTGESPMSQRGDVVMDALKNSGAELYVLCVTGVPLGQVLGDGSRQSGGMVFEAGRGVAVGSAFAKAADNLRHQYVLTYILPDGVRPNERLSLSTTRKGVTLVAPSRLSDK